MEISMKIGFIGLGNMATAMIGGIIQKGIVSPNGILGSSGTKESLQKAVDRFGICGMETNCEVAEQSDVLILAVKPQMYEKVIGQIRDAVKAETVVISIAPGKTLAWLAGLFGTASDVKLVRCMPNTPALVGEGCTGVCFGENVDSNEKETVRKILNSLGKAFAASEQLMDTVVGVSGR